ncbi:hypothetical protein FPV67DRAFT_1535125 [Lyophyllum atratum]|nr:hypothetical protein FPV67DRAFT_1535125 [Lyophyllum atratum]
MPIGTPWRAACMMVMFALWHCGRRSTLRDEGDVDVEQLAVISRDGSWIRAAGGLVWGGDSAPPVTHVFRSITRWGLGELASGACSWSAFGRRREACRSGSGRQYGRVVS